MSRIAQDDRAYFQRNVGANEAVHKYYLQNNDIVLAPALRSDPNGSLFFVYFLRPNQLVTDDRAAIIQCFEKHINLVNASIVAGDTVTVGSSVFTAVASGAGANQFNIGGTAVITATNLVAAINTNGAASASNGTPSTSIAAICVDDLSTAISVSNDAGFVIDDKQ
jgi:hypothetical protein